MKQLRTIIFSCLFALNALAQAPAWRWENPLPQGSPLAALWGDDKGLMLAVGQSGAIIRTEDEESWATVDAPTTRSLHSISGTTSSIFIAGIEGAWRSKDKGLRWEALSIKGEVHSIAAFSSGLVYALGAESQLYTSRDAGETWSKQRLTNDARLTQLWANDAGVILATPPGAIQYSTTMDPSPPKKEVTPHMLWRSVDFGKTWEVISFPLFNDHPSAFWQDADGKLFGAGCTDLRVIDTLIRSAMPMDSVNTSVGFFTSEDLGKTWSRSDVVAPINGSLFGGSLRLAGSVRAEAYPLFVGTKTQLLLLTPDGALRRSIDRGKTWESLSTPDLHGWLAPEKALWINAKAQLYYAGKQGQLSRYQDGAWVHPWSTQLGTTLDNAIELPDGSALAVGRDGLLMKRSASGVWEIVSGVKQIYFGKDVQMAQEGKELLISGNGAHLLSSDGGETFTAVIPKAKEYRASPSDDLYSLSLFGGKWWKSTETGRLLRSDNKGKTWKELLHQKSEAWSATPQLTQIASGGYLLFGQAQKIEPSTKERQTYAWLMASKDGSKWSALKDLPQVNAPRFLAQRDGTLWLGGERGELYRAKAQGEVWEKVALPEWQRVINLQETSDGRLWVFLQDAVLSSADQGKAWRNELSPVRARALLELRSGVLLLFGQSSELLSR